MSREQLEAIIQRAINDATFRSQLAKDPASALTGYDLSDEEWALLDAAKGKDFNELLVSLEARISKGIVPPRPLP